MPNLEYPSQITMTFYCTTSNADLRICEIVFLFFCQSVTVEVIFSSFRDFGAWRFKKNFKKNNLLFARGSVLIIIKMADENANNANKVKITLLC